jgi:hypothetical protein
VSELPNDWADAVAKAVMEAYRQGRIDGMTEAADHVTHFPHANVTHRRHQVQCVEQVRRNIERLKERND